MKAPPAKTSGFFNYGVNSGNISVMRRRHFSIKFSAGVLISLAVPFLFQLIGSGQLSVKGAENYYSASVSLSPADSARQISPFIWGINLETSAKTADELFQWYVDENLARNLGIKALRYPGGCLADIYDWQNQEVSWIDALGKANSGQIMPIDEIIKVADRLGAGVVYQANIEVKGIKNPCLYTPLYPGKSEPENKKQLLDDLRLLLTKYGEKIPLIELGNEQWSLWPAEEYAGTAWEFARAAKQLAPNLKVGVVGYPTAGNLADETNIPTPDYIKIWTNAVKQRLGEKCGDGFCVDFVTDHPYVHVGYDPHAPNPSPINFPGRAAFYPLANFSWIFEQRRDEYFPARLALTEWNLKNWESNTPILPAVGTVEHGMFTAESLLLMGQKNIFLSNYHHFGQNPSLKPVGLFDGKNAYNSAGQIFSLTSVMAGANPINVSIEGGENMDLPLDSQCHHARTCMRGGVSLPYLSGYAGYQTQTGFKYLFLINRHDQKSAKLNLSGLEPSSVSIKQLSANSYTDTLFTEKKTRFSILPESLEIPPLSVARLSLAPMGKHPLPSRFRPPARLTPVLGYFQESLTKQKDGLTEQLIEAWQKFYYWIENWKWRR